MKKNRMAEGLLKGLEQAVAIEKGKAKGRERTRSWEQGQRETDGAAARLLEILAGDVEIADKLAS